MRDVPTTAHEADLLASSWPVRTVPVDVDVDLDVSVDVNLNVNATLDVSVVIDRFACRWDLDTSTIDVRPGDTSRTFTVAPGMACATYATGADDLATLTLALHETGHALFRSYTPATAGPPVDPPRWLDEAVAAWAVRALEDPAVIEDEALRRTAAIRRRKRELITARLAAFEAGSIPWPADLDPSAYPALRTEPGVMAAYAAADRWPRRLLPRKVRP